MPNARGSLAPPICTYMWCLLLSVWGAYCSCVVHYGYVAMAVAMWCCDDNGIVTSQSIVVFHEYFAMIKRCLKDGALPLKKFFVSRSCTWLGFRLAPGSAIPITLWHDVLLLWHSVTLSRNNIRYEIHRPCIRWSFQHNVSIHVRVCRVWFVCPEKQACVCKWIQYSSTSNPMVN